MDAHWRLFVTTSLEHNRRSVVGTQKNCTQRTLWRQQGRRTWLVVNGFSLWSQEICLVSVKCPGEEGHVQVSTESMSRVSERRVSVSAMIVEGWGASQCNVDARPACCILQSMKCPPERRLFGEQSWDEVAVQRWPGVCSFRTALSRPAGCWRPQQAHAGTWIWTGRAARLHTNLKGKETSNKYLELCITYFSKSTIIWFAFLIKFQSDPSSSFNNF